MAPEQVKQVRRWIGNYHQVKAHLEEISTINRELLRRAPRPARNSSPMERAGRTGRRARLLHFNWSLTGRLG